MTTLLDRARQQVQLDGLNWRLVERMATLTQNIKDCPTVFGNDRWQTCNNFRLWINANSGSGLDAFTLHKFIMDRLYPNGYFLETTVDIHDVAQLLGTILEAHQ